MNFRELIFDLRRSGLSDSEIARRIKKHQSTVTAIKNHPEREPNYTTGAALIELHKTIKGGECPKTT